MRIDNYPKPARAWTVVGILIATAILSYTDRLVLSLLVDPIRGDLGITDTQISLLLGTAFAVIYGIAGVPLGVLADRTSRRNLIFSGVAVWSLGTIACGLSHTFGEIFASRLLVGLGEAALSPAAISLISDCFPPARRGTAVASFLSGIAMGNGVAILIGGAVLHLIDMGTFAGTPLASIAPWRLVMILIGGPGLLWALVILTIREPVRRTAEPAGSVGSSPTTSGRGSWARVIPIYVVLAAASFVDNAVGAWSPTLLIRGFGRDPADVGVILGILVTAGFGGGVLLGGALADRAGLRGGWPAKVRVGLVAALLVLPAAVMMNSAAYATALCSVPLYFACSGAVTAIGFSAILDVVPNRSRGFAMAVSFFLNVALGAGLGPTAVALAAEHWFAPTATLGPPLMVTSAGGYLLVILAALTALGMARRNGQANS